MRAKKYIFAALLFVSSCVANAAIRENANWTAIENILSSKKPKSVDEFIGLLPAEYKNRFVMMNESIGLQGASAEYPRIIMHNVGANVVFSFNGHTSQGGYQMLEAIKYNMVSKTYDLFEIRFPEENSGGQIHIEKNPQACLRCHGSNGQQRPLWEPYPFWPRTVTPTDLVTPEQKAVIDNYSRTLAGTPRYRHLSYDFPADLFFGNGYMTSPAFSLGTQFLMQAYDRGAKLMTEALRSRSQHPYALMAALAVCENIHEFFPSNLSWNTPAAREAMNQEVIAKAQRLTEQHYSLLTYNVPIRVQVFSDFHWIVKGLNLDLNGIGNSFQGKQLDLLYMDSVGQGLEGAFEKLLLKDMKYPMAFEDFLKIYSTYRPNPATLEPRLKSQHQALCNHLKGLSLASFR